MKAIKRSSAKEFNTMLKVYLKAEQEFSCIVWGYSLEEQAAYDQASNALNLARKNLVAAILNQPWGQDGAVFVSDRLNSWNDNSRLITLFINGRRRASVKVSNKGDAWLEQVQGLDLAEKEYQQNKDVRRKQQQDYLRDLKDCAQDLLTFGANKKQGFLGWSYISGQKGGYFSQEGRRVSANGALNLAFGRKDLTEEVVWELDREIDHKLHR